MIKNHAAFLVTQARDAVLTGMDADGDLLVDNVTHDEHDQPTPAAPTATGGAEPQQLSQEDLEFSAWLQTVLKHDEHRCQVISAELKAAGLTRARMVDAARVSSCGTGKRTQSASFFAKTL